MPWKNKYVKEFLETVCREVRTKSVHKDITEELEAHIEDQKNSYIKEGLDEETATTKAIKQMGDPVLIGKQMDMTHRPKTEWSILIMTAVLVIIAGVVQYLMTKTALGNNDNFIRFLIYVPIGIIAFIIMYFIDYTRLERWSKYVYFSVLIITIASVKFTSPVNGGYNQVYYFYLIITPILAGVICNFRSKGYLGIIYCGLFYIGAYVPCILMPSYSALYILTISSLIIMTVAIEKGFFGGNKKISLVLVYFPTLLMIIIQFLSFGQYRIQRFVHFLKPGLDPSGYGYMPLRIKSLLSGAQPVGRTILARDLAGKSIEWSLPGWNTDFTFTYIIAKFGYIFGIVIGAILIILIIRMFISVIKQKNAFGFIISFSACIAITAEILFYILSNLGLISPITVTLPFISFGASSFILNMGLMGLLLSVYRRTDIISNKLKINVHKKQIFTFINGKFIIDFKRKA